MIAVRVMPAVPEQWQACNMMRNAKRKAADKLAYQDISILIDK